MIIGMCAALFLLKPEVYTFIHGLGWVFGMYILCHTGQRLMDEVIFLNMNAEHLILFIRDCFSVVVHGYSFCCV